MSTPVLGFESGTGSVRLVLTAPHGGNTWIPGVTKRCSPGCCTVEDSFTVEVTRSLVEKLEAAGIKPYFIYTTVTRCACDFNRPAETAFDDLSVAPFYHHYHDTIEKHLTEIRPAKGEDTTKFCLLVDIHGQSENGYKDKILRGTQNGKTLPVHSQRGQDLLKCFEDEGLPLFPSLAQPKAQEHPNYNGGWTVRNYTSERVDALQLEIGWDLRRAEQREETCERLASALLSALRLPYYS